MHSASRNNIRALHQPVVARVCQLQPLAPEPPDLKDLRRGRTRTAAPFKRHACSLRSMCTALR